jgi:large subunit ribosomal protein L21
MGFSRSLAADFRLRRPPTKRSHGRFGFKPGRTDRDGPGVITMFTLSNPTGPYAVVKTGGKQYRVSTGMKLDVEKLTAEVGTQVILSEVLAIGTGGDLRLGTPTLAGASVAATVVEHGLGDKVHIFKMRRRKHYRKSQGHRQAYTRLEVTAING